jgi:hypothetical protein
MQRDAAIEAGDITMVRTPSAEAWHQPPPPTNDNGVIAGPRLVGLMGYGGAGKSEVKKILVERFGFTGPHIGLPLKNMLRSLLRDFDVDEETIERYIDGDLKRDVIPELGVTSTMAQQTLGTEWGRNCIGADLWLRNWLHRADRVLSAGGRIVQESVRFTNEADAIRARGGIIALVERPGVGPLPGGHVSEELPTDADAVIHNNGSLRELVDRVTELAA